MTQEPPKDADRNLESADEVTASAEQQTKRPADGEVRSPLGGDGEEVEAGAESDLWVGRTHWKHYAGRLALWALGNVLVAIVVGWLAAEADGLGTRGAVGIIVLVLVISGLFIVGRVVLHIMGHRYRLTTQRLFIERGILSQTIDQTELIRVDDVRVHKSLSDRLFGLGSVAILSTDASDREIRIDGIAGPDRVAEALRTRMRSMRRKSLFVENL